MPLKAATRGLIPPFIVMDVMRQAEERERSGSAVLHMEVGQPGTAAPARVREAAHRAIDQDKLGYTSAFGLWALRDRIEAHYGALYGVSARAENIVITTGSSAGFVLSFLAAFDVGDRVALASPGYPAYRNILKALGIEVVDLLTTKEDNFQPTRALLEALDQPIDGLIVASPSNPTGTMVHKSDLADLVAYCREQGVRLISDEIYHRLTYEAPAVTVLGLSRDAVIINSFSKYYSMTGWRLGWMVVPDDLLRPVECLAQNLFISPPTLSQAACVAAFDCDEELQGNLDVYRANRALLLEELPKAGFTDLAPAEGAFYIYADVSQLTNDSEAFCRAMLDQTGVAATPGVDFDPIRGGRFVRFSFAGPTADMAEAAKRLQAWKLP